MTIRQIFIDPPSEAFYGNRFFTDSELNRDECLRPYIELKKKLYEQGVELNTFDLWDKKSGPVEYYSFGMLDNLSAAATHPDVIMKGFYVFEPPVVDPSIYKSLPRLTSMFEEVYVHNTHGDGYSLDGVDSSKLKKLFWPQPFRHVLEPFWQNSERERKVVVINGNHKPTSPHGELYSKRIEAMAELSRYDLVDLYGRGWKRWYSRSSMWMPYWKYKKILMSIYKGSCESKYEVLSQYDFCLCFENMEMEGYMTEKLFDCLYAGTIPLYLGSPDIASVIPEETYVDCRKFQSWTDMWVEVNQMSDEQVNNMRLAGKQFLESDDFLKYYNALPNQFCSHFELSNE